MGSPDGKLWPDDQRFTLDRREAEVLRNAVTFSLMCKPGVERAGELRALEIRLHNFLTSTKET